MYDQILYTQAAVQERQREVARLLKQKQQLDALKAEKAARRGTWPKRLAGAIWTLLENAQEKLDQIAGPLPAEGGR